MILRAKVANISRFCVLLPQKNAKSITFYVIFTVQGIEIEDFCVILQRNPKGTYDILLDSHTITTVGIRANKCYWSCTHRAQISRIHLWFVVNRVAYGESLRLLH